MNPLQASFFSDHLSMVVSDKFSCSLGKTPIQKPILSKGFVNYLQNDSHNYQELMNFKMGECNHLLVLRTHWPKDISMLGNTHKSEDTRMPQCDDTNKQTSTCW